MTDTLFQIVDGAGAISTSSVEQFLRKAGLDQCSSDEYTMVGELTSADDAPMLPRSRAPALSSLARARSFAR